MMINYRLRRELEQEELEMRASKIRENIQQIERNMDELDKVLLENENLYEELQAELERFKFTTDDDIKAEHAYQTWKDRRGDY